MQVCVLQKWRRFVEKCEIFIWCSSFKEIIVIASVQCSTNTRIMALVPSYLKLSGCLIHVNFMYGDTGLQCTNI